MQRLGRARTHGARLGDLECVPTTCFAREWPARQPELHSPLNSWLGSIHHRGEKKRPQDSGEGILRSTGAFNPHSGVRSCLRISEDVLPAGASTQLSTLCESRLVVLVPDFMGNMGHSTRATFQCELADIAPYDDESRA